MIISAVLGIGRWWCADGIHAAETNRGVGNGRGCQGVDGCFEVGTRNADEPARGVRNHDQKQG